MELVALLYGHGCASVSCPASPSPRTLGPAHLAQPTSLGSAEAGTATHMRACACTCRYVIEDDQILFSSQHGLHANEIKQFALQAARLPAHRPARHPARQPARPCPALCPALCPAFVSSPCESHLASLWQQPECVAVEWNQNRVAGPAETEAWKAKARAPHHTAPHRTAYTSDMYMCVGAVRVGVARA